MNYEEWRKTKNRDYESDHKLYEELSDIVSDIMCEDGPDGHCDGYNLITSYILENFMVDEKS